MINFDNKICHLTFTHTDCADIWPIYFGETQEFFKTNMSHFVCVNKVDERLPKNVKPIIYDESQKYPQRLLGCLEKLSSFDTVFFDHEDMFLYDYPNEELLGNYYELMRANKFDHIRLIKGGAHVPFPVYKVKGLFRILNISPWIFSIQPSFWSRVALMEILKKNLDSNIWELEVNSQKIVRKMGLRFAYSHVKGKKRGLHHYDNNAYPFVATAIGKGKWNYSEYKNELDNVFHKYGVDKKLRGFN